MANYQLIPAMQDWGRFSEVYNRLTVYAPYSLPLDQTIVDLRLAPFCRTHSTFCVTGVGSGEEGILHASQYGGGEGAPGEIQALGIVHLLFASSTSLACWLLEQAEGWFRERGLSKILACSWQLNPWQYILHGAECYIWAGAYAAINAFRRLEYDLELDAVNMSLELAEEPSPFVPGLPGLEIRDQRGQDDFFATTGELKAFVHGRQVGECGYQKLKALSNHYHKGLGQISISADSQVHGQGVGQALLTRAHQRLYQLGARRVLLSTNQALFRAIKFYEKLGYRAEVARGYWFSKTLE